MIALSAQRQRIGGHVELLWTNSGDSHFIEPPDLFKANLPAELADRLPRSERISDTEEIVHIDGRQIRREIPRPREWTAKALTEFREAMRQGEDGATNGRTRLRYLDEQGVWGEVVYPSLGLWYNEIESADLTLAAAEVLNDYVHDELIRTSPRFVATATLPLQSVELSVREAERCLAMGFKAIFLPVGAPVGSPYWNDDAWDPLWSVLEDAGAVPSFHIGTDSHGMRR